MEYSQNESEETTLDGSTLMKRAATDEGDLALKMRRVGESDSQEMQSQETPMPLPGVSGVPEIDRYNFQSNGRDKRLNKKHYRCSNFTQGCRARYTRLMNEDGNPNYEWNGVRHDHPEPKKLKTNPFLRKLLNGGGSPKVQSPRTPKREARVNHQMDQSADLKPSMAPPPMQEEVYSSNMKRGFFADAAGFIKCVDSADFCQKLVWSNDGVASMIILLATQPGLQILSYHKYIMVDDPVSTEDYTLTTILVSVQGVPIPTAYFLHNKRTEETYRKMWSMLKEKTAYNAGALDPQFVFCNYEDAMKTSLQMEFRSAVVVGSSFHMVQASTKYLSKFQRGDLIPGVMGCLWTLCLSPNPQIFATASEQFIKEMRLKFDSYASYFQNEWIKVNGPSNWTLFSRPALCPADDDQIEEYNFHLQTVLSGKESLPLSDLLDVLYEEYHNNINITQKLINDRSASLDMRRRSRSLFDPHGLAMAAATMSSITDASARSMPQESGISVVESKTEDSSQGNSQGASQY
eukprot:TRINITY_DN4340_c0_g1_i2.p1 TRINITY_DN4340_c0_g1~~TRINITY_DN4340_c0_g1_i2.p1  ORF type:complete len:519 (-),score=133.19 TRINITY_DN4340_c0_g1_i2:61-1617(-)